MTPPNCVEVVAWRLVLPGLAIAPLLSNILWFEAVPRIVVPVPAAKELPLPRTLITVQQFAATVVTLRVSGLDVAVPVVEASGTPDCFAPV